MWVTDCYTVLYNGTVTFQQTAELILSEQNTKIVASHTQ